MGASGFAGRALGACRRPLVRRVGKLRLRVRSVALPRLGSLAAGQAGARGKHPLSLAKRKANAVPTILLKPRRPHSLHVSDARFALFNIKRDIPGTRPSPNGISSCNFCRTLQDMGAALNADAVAAVTQLRSRAGDHYEGRQSCDGDNISPVLRSRAFSWPWSPMGISSQPASFSNTGRK